jgi:hypothetical protein
VATLPVRRPVPSRQEPPIAAIITAAALLLAMIVGGIIWYVSASAASVRSELATLYAREAQIDTEAMRRENSLNPRYTGAEQAELNAIAARRLELERKKR